MVSEPYAWHALPVAEVADRLGTDPARGLVAAEAQRRLATHGPNALREARPEPWWRRVLRQFRELVIGLLLAAAGIAAQERQSSADLPARAMTYTADLLAYSPEPPDCYGNIEFEGGGRMMAQFTDIAADDLAVGVPLRMMFRVKSYDELRGFRRYFWKAAPAH